MKPEKHIVGWSEYIDLPDWGIYGLKAKMDTGARSSALHVEDLRELKGDRVSFRVILNRKKRMHFVKVRTRVERWSRVRSSTGKYTLRCFVRTTMRVGPVEKEIELSLVSREHMLFRMLIGRKSLEKDFLIDAGRRNLLSGKHVKMKKGKS